MAYGKKILLGDLLVEYKIIDKAQLEKALQAQKERGGRLGQVLVNLGYVTEQNILEILEFQLGIPQVSLTKYRLDRELVRSIPENLVKRYKVIPVKKHNNSITLAMADPLDLMAIDDIALVTGCQIEPVIASSSDIENTTERYFGMAEAVEKSFEDFEVGSVQEIDVLNLENIDAAEDEAPVIKAVNYIIQAAIQAGASDIHIEPHEKRVRVRYRVDGVLREAMNLPKNIHAHLASRVKIMAGMDIAEKRTPQDGRIQIKTGAINVDLRVSSLPSLFGEKIVIRILDKSRLILQIEDLGFEASVLEKFKNMIAQPYGMILLTGPTGSGKTSTLYAALSALNSEERNIITVEDPVEYVLDGINQVQINQKAGLTFAGGLRSILRQDPDVIMVGEIRDSETAEIAVRAATTGHLVLATLHTNDAAGALTRLIDMGIEPFQVASSVLGIVAQRLVRRICRDCREAYEMPPGDADRLFLGATMDEPLTLYRGRACERCNKTGYKGRVALHELMMISPEIRKLILTKASTGILRRQAIREGMLPIRDDGIQKIIAGTTTVNEVMRVSYSEEE